MIPLVPCGRFGTMPTPGVIEITGIEPNRWSLLPDFSTRLGYVITYNVLPVTQTSPCEVVFFIDGNEVDVYPYQGDTTFNVNGVLQTGKRVFVPISTSNEWNTIQYSLFAHSVITGKARTISTEVDSAAGNNVGAYYNFRGLQAVSPPYTPSPRYLRYGSKPYWSGNKYYLEFSYTITDGTVLPVNPGGGCNAYGTYYRSDSEVTSYPFDAVGFQEGYGSPFITTFVPIADPGVYPVTKAYFTGGYALFKGYVLGAHTESPYNTFESFNNIETPFTP